MLIVVCCCFLARSLERVHHGRNAQARADDDSRNGQKLGKSPPAPSSVAFLHNCAIGILPAPTSSEWPTVCALCALPAAAVGAAAHASAGRTNTDISCAKRMRRQGGPKKSPRHNSFSRTCDRIGQKTPCLQPNSRNVPAPVPSEVAGPAKRTHVSSAQFCPANRASHAHPGRPPLGSAHPLMILAAIGRAPIPVRPSSDLCLRAGHRPYCNGFMQPTLIRTIQGAHEPKLLGSCDSWASPSVKAQREREKGIRHGLSVGPVDW